jgi:hypothetical protein
VEGRTCWVCVRGRLDAEVVGRGLDAVEVDVVYVCDGEVVGDVSDVGGLAFRVLGLF